MPARRIRIFISSPGDVAEEREKAREVISQLQRWYGPERVALEAVLWEDLPVQLATPFQQGIEAILSATSGIDVAVFILWSRLGSPLGNSVLRADGTQYQSGTEREFELMLAAREASGGKRPALLAYVRQDDAGFHQRLQGRTPDELEGLVSQLKRAKSFVAESFHDESGRNLRAYHSFDAPVSFARRLKVHLQALLDEVVSGGEGPAAKWTRAPYRGLEAFELDDGPIFFGREKETCDVEEALRLRARDEGLAFVCVVGASGSGKSSLVRAGVASSLTSYNLDPAVRQWRVATFLPREADGRLAEGLGRALLKVLPELGGKPEAARDFLEALSKSPETAAKLALKPPLAGAQQKVLLVVDQLEEVLTDQQVTPPARAAFWAALDALARSGVVWVVATLRSDFFALAQQDPGFLRLKGGRGHYDLVPPRGEGLAALICRPATLAGLRFEASGEAALDARILDDALAQPDALPLLEYLLAELYERRTPEGLLTTAAYDALGGVAGAIGRRAEAVFQALSADVQAVLGRVLRKLVTVRADGVMAARAAPRTAFAAAGPEEALVTALTRARLLIGEGDEQEARVRVAHEALLRQWGQARRLIEADREWLVARQRLEEAHQRWTASGLRKDLMLPEGLPLAEAEGLVRAWGAEVAPGLAAYVSASRSRVRQRARQVRVAVSVALLLLAGLAAVAWVQRGKARQSQQQAERARNEALIAQSRFLAEKIEQTPSPRVAALLALEALPEHDERPFVHEVLAAMGVGPQLPLQEFAHRDTVNAVAFSPDGTRVVTGSADGTARVWQAATGQGVSTVTHDAIVFSAAFSPDGARVVTASMDKTARIWSAATGEILATLKHEDWVVTAAFSPNGARVVTGSQDQTARVWDAATGRELALLKHEGPLLGAVFSPDGEQVVTASFDQTARLWEAATGRLLHSLKHEGRVGSAAFSPDGARVVTTVPGRATRVWEVATGREVAVRADDASGRGSQFSPDGTRVLTTSRDAATVWDAALAQPLIRLKHAGVVKATFSPDGTRVLTDGGPTTRVWELATGRLLANVPAGGRREIFGYSAFSPDGTQVVTVTEGYTARTWPTASGHELARLQHPQGVSSAAFSADGRRVLTASPDGRVARLWDGATGRPLAVLAHEDMLPTAQFSPDGTAAVTSSLDKTARIWDGTTGKTLRVLVHEARVFFAAFSPDGARVATLSWGDRVQGDSLSLWDVATGQAVTTLRHQQANAVGFSPDGTKLVTPSDDKTAQVWEAATGRQLLVLRHQGAVATAAFSSDGSRLLTASADNAARLWDAATGKELVALRHDGGVRSASFSADGARILTASDDGTARLWDAVTGREQLALRHQGAVTSAQFSRDGTRVVTASKDQNGRVWDAVTGRVLAAVRHEGLVSSAAFSPDGTRVVTTCHDGTASIWAAPPRDPGDGRETIPQRSYSVAQLRTRVSGWGWCLSETERAAYFLPPMTPGDRKKACR